MEVEWLLDCEPREVQLEALRRSYYGYAFKVHRDDEGRKHAQHEVARKRWGHFLEMRLGKTPTALNEWLLSQQDHGVDRLVVLTPNTYKITWCLEFEKFGVPFPAVPLELGRYLEATERSLGKITTPVALIVNYEALQHAHGKAAVLRFMEGYACGLICDESIKLKNPNSLQTIAAFEIAAQAAYVRPMSGRPMTQGPQDLYTQLRLSGLFEGKNFYAFRNRFCKMGGFKAKKVVGVKNEDQLYREMSEGSFVAKRINWADVVDADYEVEWLRLNDEQQKHYDSMQKEFYTMIEEELVDVDQVITQWMKLQQISSGFIYDENKKAHWLDKPSKVPKVERLSQVLEEAKTKVVVCFHFKPTGEVLAEEFKKYKPAFIMGRPWMKKNNLEYDSEKQRFNNDPSCRLMLAQLDAVKYGHDLTGNPNDRTQLLVFYENTVSLDTRGQVEARITASRQDWPVMYMDLVSSDVERKFVETLIRKETLEAMVMGTYGKRRWIDEQDDA